MLFDSNLILMERKTQNGLIVLLFVNNHSIIIKIRKTINCVMYKEINQNVSHHSHHSQHHSKKYTPSKTTFVNNL